MIKKIAWDAFKKTGDINAFLEFKQIENLENGIQDKDVNNSNIQEIGSIQKITNMHVESSNEISNIEGELKNSNGNFKS